jgi:hypothetical protein
MKNFKYYIVAGVVLLLVGLLIFKYVEKSQKLADKEQVDTKVAKQIQAEATEIKKQVDKKGIETVLYDVTVNKGTAPQLASNESTRGIIDTTALALDIRTKQLKEILVIKSSLEAANLKLKKQLDSTKRVFYTYNGNGLKLRFTPPDASDSIGRADFSADVRIKATQYWKRNWLLGAKKSILAVSSDNPMFKINGADYVEFEQKEPAIGVRLQAVSNYSFSRQSLNIGPGIQFDINRISLVGQYYYDFNSNTWRPSIGARYDLVRF